DCASLAVHCYLQTQHPSQPNEFQTLLDARLLQGLRVTSGRFTLPRPSAPSSTTTSSLSGSEGSSSGASSPSQSSQQESLSSSPDALFSSHTSTIQGSDIPVNPNIDPDSIRSSSGSRRSATVTTTTSSRRMRTAGVSSLPPSQRQVPQQQQQLQQQVQQHQPPISSSANVILPPPLPSSSSSPATSISSMSASPSSSLISSQSSTTPANNPLAGGGNTNQRSSLGSNSNSSSIAIPIQSQGGAVLFVFDSLRITQSGVFRLKFNVMEFQMPGFNSANDLNPNQTVQGLRNFGLTNVSTAVDGDGGSGSGSSGSSGNDGNVNMQVNNIASSSSSSQFPISTASPGVSSSSSIIPLPNQPSNINSSIPTLPTTRTTPTTTSTIPSRPVPSEQQQQQQQASVRPAGMVTHVPRLNGFARHPIDGNISSGSSGSDDLEDDAVVNGIGAGRFIEYGSPVAGLPPPKETHVALPQNTTSAMVRPGRSNPYSAAAVVEAEAGGEVHEDMSVAALATAKSLNTKESNSPYRYGNQQSKDPEPLSIDGIVANLRARLVNGEVYTHVGGRCLVAVNPGKATMGSSVSSAMDSLSKAHAGWSKSTDPLKWKKRSQLLADSGVPGVHVFDMSARAYFHMSRGQEDQTILLILGKTGLVGACGV
ncbi:hypothetical protein HDU76_000319, partial [Blyttiomyces sp. JEL0837]